MPVIVNVRKHLHAFKIKQIIHILDNDLEVNFCRMEQLDRLHIEKPIQVHPPRDDHASLFESFRILIVWYGKKDKIPQRAES